MNNLRNALPNRFYDDVVHNQKTLKIKNWMFHVRYLFSLIKKLVKFPEYLFW